METSANEQTPLRVLVADDEEDIRSLLADVIEREPTLELVGVAEDTDEAIALVQKVDPDVAVLDWMMPGGGGARAAQAIKDQGLQARVVAITAGDPSVAAYEMMSAGAVAFLEKGCTPAEIVDAIKAAVRW